jgi:hypothetical protein
LEAFLIEVVTRGRCGSAVMIGGKRGGTRTSPDRRAGWMRYCLEGMAPSDAAALGIRTDPRLRPLAGPRVSVTANLRAPARAAAGRRDPRTDEELHEALRPVRRPRRPRRPRRRPAPPDGARPEPAGGPAVSGRTISVRPHYRGALRP